MPRFSTSDEISILGTIFNVSHGLAYTVCSINKSTFYLNDGICNAIYYTISKAVE